MTRFLEEPMFSLFRDQTGMATFVFRSFGTHLVFDTTNRVELIYLENRRVYEWIRPNLDLRLRTVLLKLDILSPFRLYGRFAQHQETDTS